MTVVRNYLARYGIKSCGVIFLLVCGSGSVGNAATVNDPFARGIDPVGFKLAATIDRYLTIEGARVAPPGSYRLSLGADYAYGLMSLKRGNTKIDNLLRDRLTLVVQGAYAAGKRIEVAFALPATVIQRNRFRRLEEATGFVDAEPASSGLGDLRLLGKLSILSEKSMPIGLALVLELRLPTGKDDAFMGERSELFAPRLVAERGFGGLLRVAVEAGYRYRPHGGQYLNLYVGDELHIGAAANLALPRLGRRLRKWGLYGEALLATPARQTFATAGTDALKTAAEGLVGVRAEIYPGLELTVGVGRGLGLESGFGRQALRAVATLSYTDEVSEKEPKQCDDYDWDKDGVVNDEDLCPRRPGPVRYDGCPDQDGDEIPDPEDKCPKEPGPPSNLGCPPAADEPVARLDEESLVIVESIAFDFDKETVMQKSMSILQAVARMLKEHSELRLVRIEGHTDSLGSASYNKSLSQRRADEVRRHLVRLGIDGQRLVAEGFGEEKPIASNKTALGRAHNRRVEFLIVERSDAD